MTRAQRMLAIAAKIRMATRNIEAAVAFADYGGDFEPEETERIGNKMREHIAELCNLWMSVEAPQIDWDAEFADHMDSDA